MKSLLFPLSLLCLCLFSCGSVSAGDQDKVRVLLIGDSTTEGGKAILGPTIEDLLDSEEGVPKVEVLNSSRGGETFFSLIDTKRYDREVATVKDVDYIFLRYGINDAFQRTPVVETIPTDMRAVLARLRADHPGAKIIAMTIIPFLSPEASQQVNKLITRVAIEEKLSVFDIYPAYQAGLDAHGNHAMNTRFIPLSKIPERFHKMLKPFTKYTEWKKEDCVQVDDTRFDPLLGHVEGWYGNSHPNSTGYYLIARETAKYLAEELRKK